MYMRSGLVSNRRRARRIRLAIVIVAAAAFGSFATGASAAFASFPTSPLLDNFATDGSINPKWITPALGEGAMMLDPAAHEMTGTDPGAWDVALWSASFTGPVEVWATINRAGSNDAALYADVVLAPTGANARASEGYFVDFGGTASGGSLSQVLILRINDVNTITTLNAANSPYVNLQAGDQIGMSVTNGTITARYKPVGGSWSSVVSAVDNTYTSGAIALEDIPGVAYGFSAFGGGTPSSPVTSPSAGAGRATTTTLRMSSATPAVGAAVRYIARVSPAPDGGTVSFTSDGATIGRCTGRAVKDGIATCQVAYAAPGTHRIGAAYSGDRQYRRSAVSTTRPVTVARLLSGRPRVRVGSRRFTAEVSCPTHSRGCRVISTATIVLGRAGGTITLKKISAKLKGGGTGRFAFVPARTEQARLRSYLSRHGGGHLSVTVHFGVRNGNGTSGTQTFTYADSHGLDLTRL
jgi:Bacterial Ig-like domain (group 3)